jgi:hypothetical protein
MKERLTYIGAIAALVLVIVVLMNDCTSKSNQLQLSKQNMSALMDSSRKVSNLLKQVQYEKNIFMGDNEMLKTLNSDLMKEVEAQKGNTRVVTKIVTRTVFDTIRINNRVDRIDDSTFVISFAYKKAFDSLNALSFNGSVPATLSTNDGPLTIKSKATTISDLSMNMKIFTGIKEEDGIYSIFARTDFPGVKFDLDGAVIDPEKNFVAKNNGPFTVVFGGGLGYSLTSNVTGIFPSIGVFVGINLLHF